MATRQQKLFGAFLEFLCPKIDGNEASRAAVWGAAAAFWGKLEPALHKRGLSIRPAFAREMDITTDAVEKGCVAMGDWPLTGPMKEANENAAQHRRMLVRKILGNALPWVCEQPAWSPTHTHRKTQKQVRVVAECLIEASMTPSVIYEEEDGTLWVRPTREFTDGRFEQIKVDLFGMEECPTDEERRLV